MKSLTVWRGHSTRPSLSAGTARKDSGHLSGRRPLHLANARPFGRLKAPLGLSLLRCAAQTRACLWQAEQAHHANNEKQEVPAGELPVVHIAIVGGFFRVRPQGAPCFILTLISVSSFFIVTFVHLSFPYVLQCICLSQQYPFGAFLYLHTDCFFYMYPL